MIHLMGLIFKVSQNEHSMHSKHYSMHSEWTFNALKTKILCTQNEHWTQNEHSMQSKRTLIALKMNIALKTNIQCT